MAYTGSVENYKKAITELSDPNSAYRKSNPNMPQWKVNSAIDKYNRMIALVNAGNSPSWSESVILNPTGIGADIDKANEQSANATFSTTPVKDATSGLQKARLEALSNAQIGGLSSRVRKQAPTKPAETPTSTAPATTTTPVTGTSSLINALRDKYNKLTSSLTTNPFGGK